jgi:Fe(3+) dicitrate transport protein
VPAAPAIEADLRPELSVNYEAGGRWRSDHIAADLVGFFSDYSNLKGTCTFSTGCTAPQEGDQFDGGRVHVYGVEAQVAADVPLGDGWHAPFAGSYTFTRSRFQHAFMSSFAAWGEVEEGDELPYLPVHQGALSAALAGPWCTGAGYPMCDLGWEVATQLRYHGPVRDVAGQGDIAVEERADALFTIDLSAHVELRRWAELYVTVDNLLNEQVVVSRRPYGARPNAPRLVVAGYKARF